jgi:hypothetical protein
MSYFAMCIQVEKILEILERKKTTAENRVYPASYHKKEGYVTLFNKKLTFFELKGFLQPTYHKIFEIPFTPIESLDDVSHNTIVITKLDGMRRYITIHNEPPLTLSSTLSNLIIEDLIDTRELMS